jgi:hypothetical protein
MELIGQVIVIQKKVKYFKNLANKQSPIVLSKL